MYIFNNKLLRRILTIVLSVLSAFLTILFVFKGVMIDETSQSLFEYVFSNNNSGQLLSISIIILIMSLILIIGSITTSSIQFAQGNKKGIVGASISLSSALIILICGVIKFSSFKNPALPIIILIVEALKLAYLILSRIFDNEIEEKDDGDNPKALVITNIVIGVLSLISLISAFFIPVYTINGINSNSLFNAFSNSTNVIIYIGFIIFFFLYVSLTILVSQNLLYINKDKEYFNKKSRQNLFYCLTYTILYYIFSIVLLFINVSKSRETITESYTLAYIPFIIESVLLVLSSILCAKYSNIKADSNFKIGNRIIVLIFTTLFIVLTCTSLFSKIIKVTYIVNGSPYASIQINGFEVLRNYANLSEGFQSLAFLIYASVITLAIFLVSNYTLFFRKSQGYYKVSFISIVVSYLLLFGLSLFGKYYEIAEKIHSENVETLLKTYNLPINVEYTYSIKSDTMIFFILSTILLIILFVIRPFSNHYKEEALDVNITNSIPNVSNNVSSAPQMQNESTSLEDANSNPCQAFSSIDDKEDLFISSYKEKLLHEFSEPTLAKITSFIVQYAKNSRLHLSYTEADIAQFIAGLGATKLSILQGMSGTGKTSLPKIFSEAIYGNVNIIEVESSWKDKNELIGYYNEFSEKFSPKKFTQALYEASFREDEITFIVLDEMNLSRIEYYFSDFLSLMENEEDKRKIKLLNVPIERKENGQSIPYKKLNDGTTLNIPKNVWFIGTANRDESTFEISDKVYDRANTINFNKRAKKVRDYQDPIDRRFVSYRTFTTLLNNAINTIEFDAEENNLIISCEQILSKYNISFGNRILNQMENFVKVYVSCFENPSDHINEAVEKILLSKVVAKLEYKSVEDKDNLRDKFERLGLYECANFIEKLNGDF